MKRRIKNFMHQLFIGAGTVRPKSFLLVTPFEGELIVDDESDSSTELYKKMDFEHSQRVVSREEYEATNLKEL